MAVQMDAGLTVETVEAGVPDEPVGTLPNSHTCIQECNICCLAGLLLD